MKLLVTGAGGQLGREIVETHAAHDVVAADRARLDITDRGAVLACLDSEQPDVVVHCGAWTAVDACESDPERAFRVNALGTRHVAEGASRVGAHVVYVSTDYVFDGTKPTPYVEWDTPNPRSVYGRSKLGGEREVRPQDTIVRTSWLFGRYGTNIVGTILRLVNERDELEFVDDQRGRPTCAHDLAEAIQSLTEERLPGIFHCANQGETTWFEFARAVLSAAGHDPERVRAVRTDELQPPRPAPRPSNSVLDDLALRGSGLPQLPDWHDSLAQVVRAIETRT